MIWKTTVDDHLFFQKETEAFLSSEFQPQEAEKIWENGYFSWKLSSKNPAGNGYLTLGFYSDKIIASVSLMKKRLLIDGKQYICAEFGDAYCSDYFFKNFSLFRPEVKIEHTSNSYFDKSIFGRIASLTTQRAIKQGIQILYAVPNELALSSWVKRLGHFKFDNHNIYSMARPMSTYISKKYTVFKIFEAPFKIIDNLTLSIIYFIATFNQKIKLSIDEVIPEKKDFDYLWEHSKPENGITLVRDYEYWNHRYIQKPNSKYSFFLLKDKGKICAIVVICIQKTNNNINRLSIVEWMILPKYRIYNILSIVIYSLRNKKFDIILTYGNFDIYSAVDFRNLFFIKKNKVNITFFETKLINLNFLEKMPLHFYMGSTDAI